jgi:hypothetical protein
MPKVHKQPLKTRPVCATTGSSLEGFSRWLDRQLQPIGKQTKSYLSGSTQLLDQLEALPPLPHTAKLFTCDAVSMYTNIDTAHALNALINLVPPHVREGLSIVMRNNVFSFGDTFWLQTDGTAMVTPTACMWATIYFAPHENKMCNEFGNYLHFYKRYIDDGFGIWDWTGTDECIQAWKIFQEKMSTFGKLKWEFTQLQTSVNFLDLTLTVNSGQVHSTLFEKGMNIYLYIPPHSAHPPGVLKGLISGMILRILRLTSDPADRKEHVQRFFD